jgi:cytochrome b
MATFIGQNSVICALNENRLMNSTSSYNLNTHRARIWDLPTRVFHWALLLCVLGLAATGLTGGNWMVWHFRFGYAVATLLLFRIIWGFVGGYWSRFASFIYSPASVMAYLQGRAKPEHTAGHNPLGAGSVFAMLLVLLAQVSSGLLSDDEIAFAGPLTRFVSGQWVSLATWWHKDVGKWLLLALVLLHIAAILFYWFKKRENLVGPMIAGDKQLPNPVPSARDTSGTRLLALVLLALCAAAVYGVASLGA